MASTQDVAVKMGHKEFARDPLRILYFSTSASLQSGATLRLLGLANLLPKNRYLPLVVLPPFDHRGAVFDCEVLYLPIKRLRRTLDPRLQLGYAARFFPTVYDIRSIIREKQVSIVHVNEILDLQGAIAAKLCGTKLVWHVRADPDLISPGWARRLLTRLVWHLADRIICVSQSVANRMFRDQGYDGDKLLTIYEAEDIGRFVPELSGQSVRDELGIRANIPVVGMVSKLQRPKGHEWFLRAAAKLRSKFPQAHFLIVGGPVDGHEQDAEFLHKLANDLGLSGNVKFMGQRNDVPQIMAACDVLVHCPTYHDPLPGVVTQAMAMQKPVVASRMGGIVEAIQHGVSGLLVPPANAEAIADAVTLLLENPQLRESMGRSGRNWVLENMHPDLYKEKLLAIYDELSGTS